MPISSSVEPHHADVILQPGPGPRLRLYPAEKLFLGGLIGHRHVRHVPEELRVGGPCHCCGRVLGTNFAQSHPTPGDRKGKDIGTIHDNGRALGRRLVGAGDAPFGHGPQHEDRNDAGSERGHDRPDDRSARARRGALLRAGVVAAHGFEQTLEQ